MNLEELDCASFEPHVGSIFTLQHEGGTDELQLAEAVEVGSGDSLPDDGGRRPFSIVFLSRPGLLLTQGMYSLEHDAMGTLTLFLVPIQPTDSGSRFEAVFT